MQVRTRYILAALMLTGVLFISASLVLAQGGPTDDSRTQQFPMGLHTISYQGRVTVNGQPYNGMGYFMFAIVDSLDNNTWTSDVIVQSQKARQSLPDPTQPLPLPVNNGLFSVVLGAPPMDPIPPDAVLDPDAVLRVWFSQDGASFVQLPDRAFTSVPWALMADSLDGYDSGEFALANHDHWGETWIGSGTGLELQSLDSWGLNVTTDSNNDYATAIHGSAASATGKTVGVWGEVQSASDEAIGVWGQANASSGKTYGVFGQNSSTDDDAAGVFGWAQGNSGRVYGVLGQTSSPDGYGVYGINLANGEGIRGESDTGDGVVGFSFAGVGVHGYGWFAGTAGKFENLTTVTPTVIINNLYDAGLALSVTGKTSISSVITSPYDAVLDVVDLSGTGDAIRGQGATGVAGVSARPTGIGVYGAGLHDSGDNFGVYGRSFSTDGVGVSGVNTEGGYAATFVGDKTEDATVEGHVVLIQNQGQGGAGPDGLAIEMPFESDKPGSHVNFITFFSGGKAVGAVEGNGNGGVVYKSGGADFAELLPAIDGLEPGDVVVIGPDGKLTRSSKANQTNVAGVYSTAPGFLGGMTPEMEALEARKNKALQDRAPIAIVGIVPVKVSAENGAIRPGDLLTASNTPGHAMKADPINVGGVEFYRPGTIIGKALEPLDEGTGVIRVLITLQ